MGERHKQGNFGQSALEPLTSMSQPSSTNAQQSMQLSFAISSFGSFVKGRRKLVSTEKTLAYQLSSAHAGTMDEAHSPSSGPRPRWMQAVQGKSASYAPPSMDPGCQQQGAQGAQSQPLHLTRDGPLQAKPGGPPNLLDPPKPPKKVQCQAYVAWARMPFFISSSNPGSAEAHSVKYLLFEAEQAELERANIREQAKQAKRLGKIQAQEAKFEDNGSAGISTSASISTSTSTSTSTSASTSTSTSNNSKSTDGPGGGVDRRDSKWSWMKPWKWKKHGQAISSGSSEQAGASAPNNMINDAWEQTLWEAFKQMDTDGSGSIDRHELQASLIKVGLPSTKEFVRDVMTEYDTDKNNSIDFGEFKQFCRKQEKMMGKAFRSIDTDGNGEISLSELHSGLNRAQLPCNSEREAERMMGLLDVNNDRTISYEEFRKFACLLPASQTTSTNHMLYAWANSSLWLDQDLTMAHQVSSPDEPYQRLLVGGVAGVISRTIIAPLERLRTLMMLSKESAGFVVSCKRMWANGGFGGLWKGHMSTVIKVFPCSAIQFGVVDACKKFIMRYKGPMGHITQLESFLAGCLAGGVACIVSHPLDTIRTQMTATVGKSSMLGVTRTIGLVGLYRGFNLSLLQEVLGSGIGFLAVDVGSKVYRNYHDGIPPSPQERGLIAALAASVVMTCVMPLDVVVKRLQVQGCPGHPILYSGPRDAFQKIASEEGLGAFYRGMLTTYMKTAPSMGAIYFFYDRMSQLWGIGGLNRYRLSL